MSPTPYLELEGVAAHLGERRVFNNLSLRLNLGEHYKPAVRANDVVLSGCFGSVGIGRSQNPTPAMQQQVAELMEQLGLLKLATERFGQLSEGQRRRLLIARALVHKPDVLVLDEPTNALDLKARHQLLELMRQLSRSGTTLLLVTHQIEAVIPEIQRCVMLKAGQLMADGPCDQVLTSSKLSALFETPLQLLQANGYRQVLPG